MADQKTKVTIKWGNKDEDTFKLNAKTLKEAYEALEQRDEWGKFVGDIGYGYNTANGIVTDVTLKPSYTLSMPDWSGYQGSPKTCQQEWDKMYTKLAEHEDGHRQVHQDILDKMEKFVEKAKNLTEKQLVDQLKKLLKDMKDDQKKFDTATGNGSKKGVVLNIAPECQ